MPASIASVIFTFVRGVNGLSLAQSQLDEYHHQVLVNTNVSNEIIYFLERWLNDVVTVAGNQNTAKLLCDILKHAFHVIPFPNSNNEEFHENLAIMVMNGSLSLGDDPLTVSDEFNRRGITLAVVAVITPTYEVWNYYRTLADNTGGKYMLLADAPAILENVILSAINEEDTLRQAFRHTRIENVPLVVDHIDSMNEQNQTTDGVGDLPFDHGLSE